MSPEFALTIGYTNSEPSVAEWRNWQTHQTQNLAFFTERVGSTPTSATTKKIKHLE